MVVGAVLVVDVEELLLEVELPDPLEELKPELETPEDELES